MNIIISSCSEYAQIYLKGAHRKAGEEFSTEARSDRTRDDGFKLKKDGFRLSVRKKVFLWGW